METVNRSRVVSPLGKDRNWSKGTIGLSFLCSHPGLNNRQLCIVFISSTVLHEIQCYGSKKNQKIPSGTSTNYYCHYNIQVKIRRPSECISSSLYPCCQNYVELMKILTDSLVWLLFWKIIIKTFARLWSNPFWEFEEVTPQLQGELLIFIACQMKGRTVVLGKTSNSPWLTACTDASIHRAPASHHFQMAIWSCTSNVVMPCRSSPLSSGSQKWKQVLIHQRILSVFLMASLCYSWQMAWFLWVEEKNIS